MNEKELLDFNHIMRFLQHRLNNYLGLVRLNLKDAIEEENSESRQDVIRDSYELVEKSLETIHEFTNFIIPTLPKETLLEEVSIFEVLEDLSTEYENKFLKRGITFKIDAKLYGYYVSANKSYLVEVFRNLIDNSIKALSTSKKKQIEVNFSRLIDNKLKFEFTDSGFGINEEIKYKVFELGISSESTGVGLWASKLIIEKFGGVIALKTSGSRTTFVITLPLSPVRENNEYTKLGKKTAIIIEDDAHWAKSLAKVTQQFGFTTQVFSTFGRAEKALSNNSYDLAILDVYLSHRLEDKTGLELAQLVRNRNPESVIIVISGYPSPEIIRDAFVKQNVDHFLDKKSFSKIDFGRVLNAVTKKRASEVEVIRRDEVNRFKYQMLGMISHELRSPLIDVQGYIENLSEGIYGTTTKKQKAILKSVLNSINRENRLIDGFLDLDRIEAKIARLRMVTFDLIKLLREEVQLYKKQAQNDNIAIRTKLSRSAVLVEGDKDRLRLVFSNLLDNALKFSPSGSSVWLRSNVYKNFVELKFSDEGPGIKPHELTKVWEWRYRSSEALSQRIKGSGLGLGICKRLIELQNGEIWISSEVKKGTIINVRLPRKFTQGEV